MKRAFALALVAALLLPGLARGETAPVAPPFPPEYRELALKWVGDARRDLVERPPAGGAHSVSALTNATNAAEKAAQTGRLKTVLIDLSSYWSLKAFYSLWAAVGNESTNRSKSLLVARTGDAWYADEKAAESEFRTRLHENEANYSSLLTLEGALYAADIGVEARYASDSYPDYAKNVIPGDPDEGVALQLAEMTAGVTCQYGYAKDIVALAEHHEGILPTFIPSAWRNITRVAFAPSPRGDPDITHRYHVIIDEARAKNESIWATAADIALRRTNAFTQTYAMYADAQGRRDVTKDMTDNVDRALANATRGLDVFKGVGLNGLVALDATDLAVSTLESGAKSLDALTRAWVALTFIYSKQEGFAPSGLAYTYATLSPVRVPLASDGTSATKTSFVGPAVAIAVVGTVAIGVLVWSGRRGVRK